MLFCFFCFVLRGRHSIIPIKRRDHGNKRKKEIKKKIKIENQQKNHRHNKNTIKKTTILRVLLIVEEELKTEVFKYLFLVVATSAALQPSFLLCLSSQGSST
jgi:hypothetical protein